MNHEAPRDPWSLVQFKDGRSKSSDQAFPVGRIETKPTSEAYLSVLQQVGASLIRDSVDSRIVETVSSDTGRIIDNQEEVGAWPVLVSKPPKPDRDLDGIPDGWESERGLNPNDGDDGKGDLDGDGYTNLEEYLNSLVPAMNSTIDE